MSRVAQEYIGNYVEFFGVIFNLQVKLRKFSVPPSLPLVYLVSLLVIIQGLGVCSNFNLVAFIHQIVLPFA